MSTRYLELAQTGIRLLRSLDPIILQRTYETTLAELLAALEWLQTLTPNPQESLVLSDEDRELSSRLQRKVSEDIAHFAAYLVNGQAKDYPDYTKVVGRIAGLKDSLKHCGELLKDED
jgi:hypothetical protein